MESQNIHIAPAKIDFNYHVFLLFIPAIVFVLVMVWLISASDSTKVAQIESDPILGTSSEQK